MRSIAAIGKSFRLDSGTIFLLAECWRVIALLLSQIVWHNFYKKMLEKGKEEILKGRSWLLEIVFQVSTFVFFVGWPRIGSRRT